MRDANSGDGGGCERDGSAEEDGGDDKLHDFRVLNDWMWGEGVVMKK